MRKLDIARSMGNMPIDKFKVWYKRHKFEEKTGVTVEDAYKIAKSPVKK